MTTPAPAPGQPGAMSAVVLGTGAADGIPAAFCRCPTCQDARRLRYVRHHGGVLIDNTILIDAPGSTSQALGRAGLDLRGVAVIAVTHAHHDHWDPSLLLHRQWIVDAEATAGPDGAPVGPLTLIGPPAVLAAARDWLAPHSDVTCVPAVVGESHDLGRHRLTVLPATHGQVPPGAPVDSLAAEAVIYEVRTDTASLLYACDTGPPDHRLLAAVAGAAYDVVLAELTFGSTRSVGGHPPSPHTPGHLDHESFAHTLDALRRAGAVTAATDVIASHIGHHNPPRAQLASALATLGARVVEDGTTLHVGSASTRPETVSAPCVLVTGGARSGKSAYAEARAEASGREVTYVATGYPGTLDSEWADRIAAHQQRRPARWRTLETHDIADALATVPAQGCAIVDCLSVWLTRVIDDADAWGDARVALSLADSQVNRLARALHDAAERDVEVYLVTNEVGSGVVPATESGRLFRDLLGRINAQLSQSCAATVLCVAGQSLVLGR